jgi:hypothetical protein
MSKIVTGYWFTSSDTLPHGDERKVIIGDTLSVKGPLVICIHGLHASREPFDALQYANGSMIYKVESFGDIIEQSDKYCSRHRKAIAVIDATSLLRQFAREQALSVKHLWDMPHIVEEYLKTGAEDIRGVAADAARTAAADAAYAAYAAASHAAATHAAACAAAYATRAAARAAANAGAAARKRFNEIVDEAFKGSLA